MLYKVRFIESTIKPVKLVNLKGLCTGCGQKA